MKILPVMAASGLALCLATTAMAREGGRHHDHSYHKHSHREHRHYDKRSHHKAYQYDRRHAKAWKRHQRKLKRQHRRYHNDVAYHFGAGMLLSTIIDDGHYSHSGRSYYEPHYGYRGSKHRYCRH